jgi:hypothetical protein
MAKQIVTFGDTEAKTAFYAPNSKYSYACANSTITRGICGAPDTFAECFNRFPSVKKIAQNLGFIKGMTNGPAGPCGPPNYQLDLWKGATTPSIGIEQIFTPIDLYLNDPQYECEEVINNLDFSWLGCLWGTPSIPFSCTCPDIGPNFYAYVKLRLNVATFWNTPKETPIQRAEFLDGLKYGKKMNITVAGDFNLKIGQLVFLNVNAASGYPYYAGQSLLNGYYYIIGVKHVVTNSGTHETALALSQIPQNTTPATAGGTFASDYP